MYKFSSDLITLNDVISQRYLFNIPIYQRLYVWGKEQIYTLLDDIVSAYAENKPEFYLGGTLVIEHEFNNTSNEEFRLFDLIDGQQRFTTLWLISVVLQDNLKAYRQVESDRGVQPRISFAIRPQVTEFFEKVCRGEKASLPQAKKLEDALQEIHSYFDNYSSHHNAELDKTKLAEFIRTKVQLILTQVPQDTDLNKLFEVINNRGVQLQHHEILKAKLLEKINQSERESYALLWDACSDMNGYVERHLRQITKVDTVSLYETQQALSDGKFVREHLADSRKVLDALQHKQLSEEKESVSLKSILGSEVKYKLDGDELELDNDTGLPDRVSSIITFSMLLQHVLRIYLKHNPNSFDPDISKISDKDLLLLFGQHWLKYQPTESQVKQFIELLWQTRYQFDKHIIKWILIEEEKVHAIRRLYINRNSSKNTAYLQRLSTDAEPDFALLQSMLYHSQQMTTQYWLTPLLGFLLDNDELKAHLYLQHIDNNLLCSAVDAPLIERTQRYLQNPWHCESILDAEMSLNQTYENGTQYPHYWFYKLEYVLYLKHKAQGVKYTDDFRMAAKNSVEHVTPQNPEQGKDRIPDDLLHSFGNLALVTRSINSEMSNKGFSIKKVEFEHRYKGKGVSLKLEDIYANDNWQYDQITKHQEQMIADFNSYIQGIKSKSQEFICE